MLFVNSHISFDLLKKTTVKAIIFVFFFFTLSFSLHAIESNDDVVVAYIDYENFVEIDSNGNYYGYAVDYFHKISKYTGKNYIFKAVDWTTSYGILEGSIKKSDPQYQKIDLFCVARQTEERQHNFDFSLFPVCYEKMNLYSLKSTDLCYNDFVNFNNVKVGILEGSGELDCFINYQKENGFRCKEIIQYPNNQEIVSALLDGQIDAAAVVRYCVNEKLKVIGNFGVSPAYIMGLQGSEYVAEISSAQEKLFFEDQLFTNYLENKYYSEDNITSYLMLTRDEIEYLKKLSPLNVAISTDMAPIEYFDKDLNKFKGVTVDVFELISELTGLEFNFLPRKKSTELISQIDNGVIQLIGVMANNSSTADSLHVIPSYTIFNNSIIVVSKKEIKDITKSTVAVPSSYPLFTIIAKNDGYQHIKEYNTIEQCMRAVYKGDADITYINSFSESYFLSHVLYNNTLKKTNSGIDFDFSIGIPKTCDTLLLSIINKTLSAIPSRKINDIVMTNTLKVKPDQTLVDLIYHNLLLFIGIIIVILSLVTFIVAHTIKVKHKQKLADNLAQQHNYIMNLYKTLPCGVFLYEYETPHKIINSNASCAKIYGYDEDFTFIDSYPDSVVEAGTEHDFQEKFNECEKKGGPISYEWSITRRDGSQAFTQSVMDIVKIGEQKIFQEALIDITERKNRELNITHRYANEINNISSRSKDLLYFACFDVDDQILIETSIDVKDIKNGISVSDFINGLWHELSDLQTEREMEDFALRFTKEKLQKDYDDGHFEQSFLLCRHKDSLIQWVRSDLTLSIHPITGHLMCFDYIYDVTAEQVSNTIMRDIAFSDCDSFLSLDVNTGNCLQYVFGKDRELIHSQSVYGKNDLTIMLAEKMTKEDADVFLEKVKISVIAEQLRETTHYQVYATLYGNSNEREDKSLTFFYTHKKGNIIAMSIVDVTEIRASEVRQANLLRDALNTAEKADQSKSQFLSRVSHEMRTPLNAIIGFIELAKGESKEKMEGFLASSDIAAKQLLNVINDVLDMSSIESRMMKIAKTPFNFKQLISSISNIYGTQCFKKGLNFESKVLTLTDDWIIGDELRVNQILMNLLGNALKFTNNGHIWLEISQTIIDNNKVNIKFVISDTGCGMSDDMKLRLFKPFEQENATTAKKYGGNGLGLSIVKNLVTMMNGMIKVDSKENNGTTFTVDLPFERQKHEQPTPLLNTINRPKVLVVDDDEAQCEYLKSVLREMQIIFSCVSNADEALIELSKGEADNKPFNVCLVDWKMPGLNELDTTSIIRKKYGKDIIVIILSAYDFEITRDSALKTGANMFLSKPLFQSTLFDLFMTLTNGKIGLKNNTRIFHEFPGKKVLVAEDNLSNQIVIKGYLAKLKIQCEIYQNGQQVVDKFLSSPVSSYDAILMDFQMPVMDGLEATKIIRESNHPEAKSIQIVALTADAFNEDISRALSCGMNAHVSKPIQIEILIKTLMKVFSINN